jgi:hypothetical protein
MKRMIWAILAGLTACGPARQEAPGTAEAIASPAPVAGVAAALPAPGILACSTQIGMAAAQARVKVCRNVSPATHPPCNAVNSCAMIEDEIARSCALFDGKDAPMPGCAPAPKSAQAAAAVIERYYAAIGARDYATAWQQWGDHGPPRQTLAQFTAGFAGTRSVHVTIGALPQGDAGAGSIYQSVPVTVEAVLDDGTHQRFGGDYTVRRVNDVDGATPDQLRWHIDGAHLKPV